MPGAPEHEDHGMTHDPGDLEESLDLITPEVERIVDLLGGYHTGPTLIVAGLDLLPAGRCTGCQLEALMHLRSRIDQAMAELRQALGDLSTGQHRPH